MFSVPSCNSEDKRDDRLTAAREEAILRRWPHLARPGDGQHNQIPPNFEEALERAGAKVRGLKGKEGGDR